MLVFHEMEVDHDVCPAGLVRVLETVFDAVNDDLIFFVLDQPGLHRVPSCSVELN